MSNSNPNPESSSDESDIAVAEPVVRTRTKPKSRKDRKPKRQPRYHVVLWDDDDHSYDYVIGMMRSLFGFPYERGFEIAKAVDKSGRAICLTTTKEHAELKCEQIQSFGRDVLIARCQGSMSATIEPATEST